MVSASPDQLVVDTAFGKVRGVDEGTYSAFKGIPYEASTAGEGRWTAPKDPEPWEDVRDATKFGAICPQPKPVQDHFAEYGEMLGVDMSDVGVYTIDEDCLFLNVYTPNVTGDLPVMVWIHGGEFKRGPGSTFPRIDLSPRTLLSWPSTIDSAFLAISPTPTSRTLTLGCLTR